MVKNAKKKGKASKAEDAIKLAQLEAERKAAIQSLKSTYYAKSRSFLREPLPSVVSFLDQAINKGEPISKILFAKLRLSIGDLWAFVSTFQTFSELTSLKICLVELDDKMLGILAHFIRVHPPLDTLSLIACSIGPSIGNLFMDALPQSSLLYFTLDFNTIGQGWPPLFKSMLRSKLLKVSGISTLLDARHIESLKSLLESNPLLRELDLSCNHIGTNGFLQLCHSLEGNTHLESINVSSNEIRVRTSLFPPFLDPLSRLQLLDLRHNLIETIGGETVLEMLKARKTMLQENRSSTPLCILVTERLPSPLFSKINELNKWMDAVKKKKKKKKKSGDKASRKKK